MNFRALILPFILSACASNVVGTPDGSADVATTPEASVDALPSADAAVDVAPSVDAAPDVIAVIDASSDAVDAASDAAVDVAPVFDGRRVTYEADMQPLFSAKCSRCHHEMGVGGGGAPGFIDGFAATQLPSRLCTGQRVGQCINRALQVQRPEGGRCRTYETPFHREGWVCLDPSEIALVAQWVAMGMIER